MNFKKINNTNGSDYYPQVNDIKMIRITMMYPTFRTASMDEILDDVIEVIAQSNISDEEDGSNVVQIEESDISLNELTEWADANNCRYFEIHNHEDGGFNSVQTVIDNTNASKKETVEAVKTEIKKRKK